jgi:hypothetical protein
MADCGFGFDERGRAGPKVHSLPQVERASWARPEAYLDSQGVLPVGAIVTREVVPRAIMLTELRQPLLETAPTCAGGTHWLAAEKTRGICRPVHRSGVRSWIPLPATPQGLGYAARCTTSLLATLQPKADNEPSDDFGSKWLADDYIRLTPTGSSGYVTASPMKASQRHFESSAAPTTSPLWNEAIRRNIGDSYSGRIKVHSG